MKWRRKPRATLEWLGEIVEICCSRPCYTVDYAAVPASWPPIYDKRDMLAIASDSFLSGFGAGIICARAALLAGANEAMSPEEVFELALGRFVADDLGNSLKTCASRYNIK